MNWLRRLLRWSLWLTLAGIVVGVSSLGIAYWLISPRLPKVETIRDMPLQVPLKVVSADQKLIAVFGETRRTPVEIANVPDQLKNAFIAVEDLHFYQHPGIDWRGILRAVYLLAKSGGGRVPGGSTITQQVARNYFLSAEYSYSRKLSEIFLALRMEKELSKDEILSLYLNKIFFGYRAYGVVAAADFYYGKPLNELSLAECATLASLPKFPSSGNPISNPDRALIRRNYALRRMLGAEFINQAEFDQATAEIESASPHEPAIEVDAPYVAEMARQTAIDRLGADALNSGHIVVTTIDSAAQLAANAAIRKGLLDYDRRHGYRGAEAHTEWKQSSTAEDWAKQLQRYQTIAGLIAGLVTEVNAERASLFLSDGQSIELTLDAMLWAAPYLSENSRGARPKLVSDVLQRGDIVRAALNDKGEWTLSQMPKAQAALVSIKSEDGAIQALVGGFSFSQSKFNRAIQSNRQPGSSFKPFIYSAAFERGFNPASIVNDAPLVFSDPSKADGLWKPQNDNEEFEGPMRLREAMVASRNLVSVRLLDAIGIRHARDYITKFGFTPESLPANLSLALGTSSVPPIAMARGYAVFANGGYLVDPYFVQQILTADGTVVFQANAPVACFQCKGRLAASSDSGSAEARKLSHLLGTNTVPAPLSESVHSIAVNQNEVVLAPLVIDERNAFLTNSLLRDVVRRGTGSKAMALKRNDLGGKTGTTNEFRDAWFSGFNREIVTTTWVGFDDFTPLGRGEFASQAALPIWMHYMGAVLEGMPETPLTPPPGISTALIDASSGLLVEAGKTGINEFFKVEDLANLRLAKTPSTDPKEKSAEAYEIF